MLTKCPGYADELVHQWKADNIERMEAECGCELPELSDATLKQRAQRLLDCPAAWDGDEDDLLREIVDR